MTSRIVTRAGREAPKYVQAFLRQAPAAATTEAASTLLMSHARSSQQAGVHGYQPSPMQKQIRFLSDKTATPPPPSEEDKPADTAAAAAEEAGKPAEEEAAAEEIEPELSREEQLEADLAKMEEELKEAKNQLLRSLAEQENTRRIAKRDVSDARNFAVKSFAKSLLEVSDNLTRALEVVPEELRKDTENNATLATLYEGIQMTETGLVKAFESNGLKKFGVPGEAFDPNQHSALYEYPDSEKEPGTVGQVIKVGFKLNDRVLRPAEVGVVKKE